MQPPSMEIRQAPALPDDVLEDILGRLTARSLAASRQVCKAWRDIVDNRRLLLRLRRLLPHSLHGFFVNYVDHGRAHFFARPTAATAAGSRIDGEFSFIEPEHEYGLFKTVADHCNGLVLYRDDYYESRLYVCNPATRRWVCLPPLTIPVVCLRRMFLMFNPSVSRHYEVFVYPLDPEKSNDITVDKTEWPPSRWTWHVFSSRTGQWRERVFIREGEAAGLTADMAMDSVPYVKEARWRYAVYWRGVLYVHCHGEYVSR
ncbi:unnamed protein product [Urochloa humidicola]